MEPLDQLSLALGATEEVISGVRPGQWTDPTPCEEWDVGQLVDHIVAGNQLFVRALDGGPPPSAQGTSRPAHGGRDRLAAYRDSGAALLAAFGEPGALERDVAVPIGSVPGTVALHLRVTELLVHGWDVARATGQRASLPEDLAEQELAFSRSAVSRIPPDRSPFGPPQPVAEDASAVDRLVALLGRDVSARQ